MTARKFKALNVHKARVAMFREGDRKRDGRWNGIGDPAVKRSMDLVRAAKAGAESGDAVRID